MNRFVYIILAFTLCPCLWSQSPPAQYRPGELIIQLWEGQDFGSLFKYKSRAFKSNSRELSPKRNLHLIRYSTNTDLAPIISALSKDPAIMSVQYNRILTRRGGSVRPNDPLYTSQWNLERIGLPDLWNETRGGITPCGDTIVIAVNDFGLDVNHEDIQGVIWKNKGEIPNNGFDDDGNGYIDDYVGLNLDTGDDKHGIDDKYTVHL